MSNGLLQRITGTILVGLAMLTAPAAVSGQEQEVDAHQPPASPGAPVAQGVHTDHPPSLDGRLDDPAWVGAPAITGFVQHEPLEGRPATERTEVRVLFDREAIYVGAWLFDADPSAIVLGEARRDVDLEDMDAFLIVFDTFLDRQNAFVFGTTPAGIEYDGQVTKEGEGGFTGVRQQAGSGGGLNLNWDGSWDVATSVDADGWYAEFRIPFSTLRYGGGGSQRWGMNLARFLRRRNEQSFWAPIPRQHDLYRISLAGTLEGIVAAARRTVTVTPFALSTAHRDFGDATETDLTADIGGDVKVGLTPSLTLDLTYNTDFAQVEVDEQQLDLTRFELFFPEKRPFFLENAGTFSVGTPQSVELFFSRRIGLGEEGDDVREVPIVGGGRLSGKPGGLSIGFLNIQTNDVGGGISKTNYGAARVSRELPNRSRVGAIVTSRLNTDSTADYNLTYGIDGRMGLGDAITLDGYLARTETPGLLGGEHAYAMSGSYQTRDWFVGAAYREVAEDFNPEVGFLDRRAYRAVSGRLLRHVRLPAISWFRELRPHITYRQFIDLDGFTETRLIHIDNHFEFANGAFFQLPAINFTREGLKEPFEIADNVTIPPGTYDNVEWGFEVNTNLSSPLSYEARIEIGGFYSGHRKGISGTLSARVGSRFIAAFRHSMNDVDLPEGSFETALMGLRLSYSFTPRIYLQSLIQYNNQTDEFSGNFRFGWLSTAGTGLFVVFNEIQSTERPTGPVDRVLIVKFTRRFDLAN